MPSLVNLLFPKFWIERMGYDKKRKDLEVRLRTLRSLVQGFDWHLGESTQIYSKYPLNGLAGGSRSKELLMMLVVNIPHRTAARDGGSNADIYAYWDGSSEPRISTSTKLTEDSEISALVDKIGAELMALIKTFPRKEVGKKRELLVKGR